MFDNGILLNGVLIPKLLNNSSVSSSFITLDFLLPQTTHFDIKANLPFLVFITFASLFFVLFFAFQAIC